MSKILGAISFWESTVAVIFFFMLLSFSLLFLYRHFVTIQNPMRKTASARLYLF